MEVPFATPQPWERKANAQKGKEMPGQKKTRKSPQKTTPRLRSRPPCTGVPRGPGRKVPHGVLLDSKSTPWGTFRPGPLAGKKKSIHRPAPVQNFSLQKKNGVHRGKISVVDMVFLVFIGFFVSTNGLESFSLRPEKFSKRFSFGGGCVCFFLLCPGTPVHGGRDRNPKGPKIEIIQDRPPGLKFSSAMDPISFYAVFHLMYCCSLRCILSC